MIILIGAFVLSYFPFIITSTISASQEKEDMRTSAAHSLAVLPFIFGNSAANPLIYFWRVTDFREAAKQAVSKLFHLKITVETEVTVELEIQKPRRLFLLKVSFSTLQQF